MIQKLLPVGILGSLLVALYGIIQSAAAENISENSWDWQFSPADGVSAGKREAEGISYLSITVPETVAPAWPRYIHKVRELVPGALISFEAGVSSPVTRDGAGAYITVEFLDSEGKRIALQQSDMVSNESAWQHVEALAAVPANAAEGLLCLVFNGIGEGRFTDPHLEILPPESPNLEADTAVVHIQKEAAGGTLLGIGFEDDGWTYNQDNREKGVGEADWNIRESRIAWMRPDLVRMFFWYKDWNPSGDWKTFDFETDNMRSHYRSLEVYQRMGCPVIVTGVEWGLKDPYGEPESCAAALGTLLEHLIRERGFTCVRYWTLTNEPNGYFARTGYDFNRYRELHRLVAEQIRQRNLSVEIVGSDDAMGTAWFNRCVTDDSYYASCGVMSSHFYVQYSGANRIMRHLLNRRLQALEKKPNPLPFVVAEFGFQDHRSTVNLNPIMETYDYALWTMEFAIDGLNRGARGFSIWCLHDVWYPRVFMGYGLWRFKDENWRLKPVYYAWSALTRLTERGDSIFPCSVEPGGTVRAVGVGKRVVFWVNPVSRPYIVEIQGMRHFSEDLSGRAVVDDNHPETSWMAYIFEENHPEDDRYEGRAVPLKDLKFEAPPRSYGYIVPAALLDNEPSAESAGNGSL